MMNDPTPLDHALNKVTRRLHAIEHAIDELAVAVYPEGKRTRANRPPGESQVLINRTATCILGIYHLKDDAKGVARTKGLPKDKVDLFVESSRAIDLCVKAGDTYKHGSAGGLGIV
jgi:hypothetical protein